MNWGSQVARHARRVTIVIPQFHTVQSDALWDSSPLHWLPHAFPALQDISALHKTSMSQSCVHVDGIQLLVSLTVWYALKGSPVLTGKQLHYAHLGTIHSREWTLA